MNTLFSTTARWWKRSWIMRRPTLLCSTSSSRWTRWCRLIRYFLHLWILETNFALKDLIYLSERERALIAYYFIALIVVVQRSAVQVEVLIRSNKIKKNLRLAKFKEPNYKDFLPSPFISQTWPQQTLSDAVGLRCVEDRFHKKNWIGWLSSQE